MTKANFLHFLEQFNAVFPDFGKWWNSLPNGAKTAEQWHQAFLTIELDDALRIIPLMRDSYGTYEPLAKWDYERLPSIIPRYVRKFLFENQAPEPKPHYEGAFKHVTEDDATMAKEFKRLMATHDELATEKSAAGDMYRDSSAKVKNEMALERMGGVQL